MTELRRRILGDWPLKAVAVVFAVALWAFVVTEERTDAVFTVPLDLVDRPPGLEVASIGVESVVVRVEGRHSRLRRLHEEDFRAEVSLKSAQAGRFVGRIDTDNVSAPAGVRVVRVTPSEVRAILEARR
jgi:YbbR-like protein